MTTTCASCGWNGDPNSTTRITGPLPHVMERIDELRLWMLSEGFDRSHIEKNHQGASSIASAEIEFYSPTHCRWATFTVYNTGVEYVMIDGGPARSGSMHAPHRLTPRIMACVAPFLRGESVKWREPAAEPPS